MSSFGGRRAADQNPPAGRVSLSRSFGGEDYFDVPRQSWWAAIDPSNDALWDNTNL